MTLPNWLTLLRLLLVPLIALALTITFSWHDQVATGLYALAALTDTLDGRIARRWKLETELGKFLDPLVDKILVITVLAVLVGQALLPFWVVVVIFAREFLITGLRSVAASQGVVVGATVWGKSKTFTQNIMIGLLLLQRPYPVLYPAVVVSVGIAVSATVLSGLDYLWRYRRFVI
jgi:CDP-diacylglycerol--glycerol-3-phosphate 3-phosphatidyltransferase